MYDVSDFRNNLKIEVDGQPYSIVFFQHVKPGKGNAFTRTKLRNLLTNNVVEITFKSGEKVGKPDMEERTMQFLYPEGTSYHFMDTRSYEQLEMSAEQLGDQRLFLQENIEVQILLWNGKPIAVELPIFVFLKVVETDPGVKGDTVSGGQKPAKLETGATINVPLFINEGETLKIDTRTQSYVERAG